MKEREVEDLRKKEDIGMKEREVEVVCNLGMREYQDVGIGGSRC
jgi:hypothetical protein